MKTLTILLALTGVASAQQKWAGYDKGVKWEASLDQALKRAAKEAKPVLLYQLVGDLKREGC